MPCFWISTEISICTDYLNPLIVVRLTVLGLCRWRTPTKEFRAQEKNLKLWESEEYGRTENPHSPYVSSSLLSFLCLFLLHAFGIMPFSMQKTANLAAFLKRSSFIRRTSPPSFSLPLSSYRLPLGFRYKSQTCWVLAPCFSYFFIFKIVFKESYWAGVSWIVRILWREM